MSSMKQGSMARRASPCLEVHYMRYVDPWWRGRKLTTILSRWRSGDKLAINKDRPWDFLTYIGTTISLANQGFLSES